LSTIGELRDNRRFFNGKMSEYRFLWDNFEEKVKKFLKDKQISKSKLFFAMISSVLFQSCWYWVAIDCFEKKEVNYWFSEVNFEGEIIRSFETKILFCTEINRRIFVLILWRFERIDLCLDERFANKHFLMIILEVKKKLFFRREINFLRWFS